MKKKVVMMVLIVIVLIGVIHHEHNYTMNDCVVVEASQSGALIKNRASGEQWYVEEEGLTVGDEVLMLMYDNYTSAYIYDDKVMRIIK
jgi:hypothetical protein